VLEIGLLTKGSPDSLTGGHLYQRMMADAAPAHDATITFVQAGLLNRGIDSFDVVVVDSITAWRLAPHALWRTGPLAAVAHQPPGGVGTARPWRPVQRALDRFVYERCDTVIATSRALAAELVAEHRLDPSRVRVVEPGCDLAPGSAGTDLRQGHRIAVLCVANWLPHKGVLKLIEAVATLPTGAAVVHLAGRDDVDRTYSSRVRERVAASDVAGRVVVHGALDRRAVADLYAGADVFVLPSAVETYGMAFAEALRAGLPIVGWRVGNLPNLITDGVEGCLVTPGDVAALGRVLGRLADDVALRARLASAARRRGALLPTWADAARAFFRALRESVAGAVEPADDGASLLDVDAADAGVLDVHPPGDPDRDTKSPGEGSLDRADVRHDHDDGRSRER
jgi:glycosyltransferase involved in cell wall biosynthesis